MIQIISMVVAQHIHCTKVRSNRNTSTCTNIGRCHCHRRFIHGMIFESPVTTSLCTRSRTPRRASVTPTRSQTRRLQNARTCSRRVLSEILGLHANGSKVQLETREKVSKTPKIAKSGPNLNCDLDVAWKWIRMG